MKLDGKTIAIGAGVILLAMLMLGKSSEQKEADVDDAVKLALAKEKDPRVLRSFAADLRAAGRFEQATMLEARAVLLEAQLVSLPIASGNYMATPAQTAQTMQTMQQVQASPPPSQPISSYSQFAR